MIPFVILLISTTSALSADFTNNGQNRHPASANDQVSLPMDYFDDIFNQDIKTNPESMLTYNFQQARHGQPPQVEIREEHMGRYFRRPTTTTKPTSIFSMDKDSEVHVYPNANPVPQLSIQQSNEPQISTMPPVPKFAFSRLHNHNEAPHEFNNAQFIQSPIVVSKPQSHFRLPITDTESHPTQIQTTAAPAVQWTRHRNIQNHNAFVPTSIPNVPHYVKENDQIMFAPSESYVSDTITDKKHSHHSTPSRGHHKFSWDDIKNENQGPTLIGSRQPVVLAQVSSTIQPSTASPINHFNKAPPPVPTLSPWYDGFGK